jgi:chromosomal replication initiator protein
MLSAPLWDRCLTQLESELSEQQLNTWIRPLQAQQAQSHLKIMAPNRFVRDMVQDNFYPRIQEIAGSLDTKSNVKVDLVIGTGASSVVTRSTETRATQTPFPARPTAVKVAPVEQYESNLNPEFSFGNLIEGKSNQIGRAAALQIGKNPGKTYNPFLIYGASGLGKTHLMHAIGHTILQDKPDARVLYINSERYVAEMVSALQHSKMNQFKQFYRGLDALLVDDIQFFAGKEQTQEEFFHNFNALFEGGQQIILTCDRYPKEVNGLADRLVTRFGWGLTVAVEPPELEMRVAILNSKAEQAGFELPSEVSFFLAKHIRSNVRELEGALRRVIATAMFTGAPVTLEFAKEALSDLLAVQAKLVTVENIQKTVAEYYKIRLADLSAKSRSRSIARPRQVAMSLAKELTSKSLPEIGKAFGGRDHTTVLHACRKITELRGSDTGIREDYANLMRILTS